MSFFMPLDAVRAQSRTSPQPDSIGDPKMDPSAPDYPPAFRLTSRQLFTSEERRMLGWDRLRKEERDLRVFLRRIDLYLLVENLRQKAQAAGIPPAVIAEAMRGCTPA